MKTLALLVSLAASCSCAQTVLYRDGKPLARFQGDMKGVAYRDGDTSLTGDINHSAATLAQGQAAQGKIDSAGIALAASGLTSLLK